MGHDNRWKILLLGILLLVIIILLPPKAHGQVPGQPANKEQARSVLQRLIDSDLVSMEVRLGNVVDVGTGEFQLLIGNDEIAGSIAARVINNTPWLESLKLDPPAAGLQPSVSPESLREKLHRFFGGTPDDWPPGATTTSIERADVWIDRQRRKDTGLVIEFMYSRLSPVRLYYIEIATWPAQ